MLWFRKSKKTDPPPVTPDASHTDGSVRLSELLARGSVKVPMLATEKEEAFEELVDLLARTGAVKDAEAVLAAVHRREAMGSTGVGNGVAVPHGKHASVETLTAALGIAPKGIEFDALDGKPVQIVFLLLAREDTPGPHLQALAEIAQLVNSPTFVKKLIETRTAAEALRVVQAEEQA